MTNIDTLGAEVKRRGFNALKTNILPFDGETLTSFTPGFGRSPGHPELNWGRHILQSLREQLAAFREGAGPDIGLAPARSHRWSRSRAGAPFDLSSKPAAPTSPSST